MNQNKTYNIPGRLHSIGSEGIVAGADEILDDELNLKQNEINVITGTHIANDEIHVTAAEKEYWNSKVNPPSYSAPTAKQLTYTGEAQDLLNPGSSTTGNIQYSTDETNWSTTVPQETNAGTYTVYWRFIGSELVYIDSTAINVTIAKANPTYTTPTGKSGLVYNASAQELLNAGSTSDGTISYSEDGENWSNSVPSKTNAGDYVMYWKLDGGTNYNSIASTTINVSIAKVTPTVTAPTAKSGLAYTGSAQELVNAGSTDFGTLQYSTDNENWGTTIPSGTNAGDYSIYYKVVGDSNINDIAATNISVSIAKVSSASFSNNETSLDVGETNTISVIVQGNPTITVSSSNISVATVNGMIITAVGSGTTTITATIAADTNYNAITISYTLIAKWGDGIYAVKTDGTLEFPENINTSSQSSYVGVGIINNNINMKFFIGKIFKSSYYGYSGATNVYNDKGFCPKYKGYYNKKTQTWQYPTYMTSLYGTEGGDPNVPIVATDNFRSAALADWNNGNTGISNTTKLYNDTIGSSSYPQGYAITFCRDYVSNPVTGEHDGYIGHVLEWITVADNLTEINNVLNAIGGAPILNTMINNRATQWFFFWSSSTYFTSDSSYYYNFAWELVISNPTGSPNYNFIQKRDFNPTSIEGGGQGCIHPFFPLNV